MPLRSLWLGATPGPRIARRNVAASPNDRPRPAQWPRSGRYSSHTTWPCYTPGATTGSPCTQHTTVTLQHTTEQKLRANEPTLTTTALVSRNKNQNKVSAKWIRNISALTLKQHETPLFLFLVSFYILVKSCSIFISIEKQSSNSESNEM